MFPSKEQLRICFAHPAYQMALRFAARESGITHRQVRTPEELAAELPDTDVLVVSQMWKNELAARTAKLRFIQSISAGVDQYDQQLLRGRGIRMQWEQRIESLDIDRAAWDACLSGRGLDGWDTKLPSWSVGDKISTRKAWKW